MIPPEQRAEIRRLYYAEHWRIGTIATTLGVHHDTVRVAIERFIRPGTQVRPSTLDPYKPMLLATLEQYPRLRAHAAVRDDPRARLRRLRGPGPALGAHGAARGARRSLPAPGDAARRAGPGRLGELRPPAGRRRAPAAVVLRPRAVVVARRLRPLRPGPDAGKLSARPRRSLRGPGRRAPDDPLRQSQERRPRPRRRSHPLPPARA